MNIDKTGRFSPLIFKLPIYQVTHLPNPPGELELGVIGRETRYKEGTKDWRALTRARGPKYLFR
jgi:hypothetical protein